MSTNKQRVTEGYPTAFSRPPNDNSIYPGEWTVGVPPIGFGFFRILGHGKTASAAWHDAARKIGARIYRIPGAIGARHYEERKPVFPCTVFAPAINNGQGTPCPDKKTFARINDYCFPSSWTPALT